METPVKVKEAFIHIREFHPNVVKVAFDKHGQWKYTDSNSKAPKFDDRIDVGILEDASDSVTKLPCVFIF